MGLTNSNLNYTGLVQKYIGTAYDKMAAIHDKLEELLLISDALETDVFDELFEALDDVLSITAKLDEFFTLYLGSFSSAPIADTTIGEEFVLGALYFDTTEDRMYVFTNTGWIKTGDLQKTVEQFVITADQATQFPLVINFQNEYVVGSNNLTVYIDREHYFSTNVNAPPIGVSNSTYVESSIKSISIPNGLVEGQLVVASINTDVTTVSYTLDVEQYIIPTTNTNQQIIMLPPDKTYLVGQNNLEVYMDRQLQVVALDYLETAPDRITFINPISFVGTEIIINVGNIIGNSASLNNLNTIFQPLKPDENLYEQGQQWFDTTRGRMFLLYVDTDSRQWLSITGENEVLDSGGGTIPPAIPPVQQVRETIVQVNQPDPGNYSEGALWFNSRTGEMFFLYIDEDFTSQWVKVST